MYQNALWHLRLALCITLSHFVYQYRLISARKPHILTTYTMPAHVIQGINYIDPLRPYYLNRTCIILLWVKQQGICISPNRPPVVPL